MFKNSLIFEQKNLDFHGFSENSQISADSISMKTFSISKKNTIYNTYVPRSVHCAMFRGAVGFLKIRFRSMKLGEFPKFHFHHPTIVFYLRILKESLRIKKLKFSRKHLFCTPKCSRSLGNLNATCFVSFQTVYVRRRPLTDEARPPQQPRGDLRREGGRAQAETGNP